MGCATPGYPAWDRARVMEAVVDLLATEAMRADGLPVRHFPFATPSTPTACSTGTRTRR